MSPLGSFCLLVTPFAIEWWTKALVFHFFLFITRTEAEAVAQSHCMTNCLQDFLNVAGNSAGTDGLSSWQQVLKLSEQATPEELKTKFDIMCQSYTTLKYCMRTCPNAADQQTSVTNGFTSLQYVCEDRYTDFLKHLPCLVKNEVTVLNQCKLETTKATAAIASLQQAAFDNNFSDLKSILIKLCSNTNDVMHCMAPVTEEMCGKEPAEMLKTLVSLGFRNTETLYTKLGLRDQLPDECINLGKAQADFQEATTTYELYESMLFRTSTDAKPIQYHKTVFQSSSSSRRDKIFTTKSAGVLWNKKQFVVIFSMLFVMVETIFYLII